MRKICYFGEKSQLAADMCWMEICVCSFPFSGQKRDVLSFISLHWVIFYIRLKITIPYSFQEVCIFQMLTVFREVIWIHVSLQSETKRLFISPCDGLKANSNPSLNEYALCHVAAFFVFLNSLNWFPVKVKILLIQ